MSRDRDVPLFDTIRSGGTNRPLSETLVAITGR